MAPSLNTSQLAEPLAQPGWVWPAVAAVLVVGSLLFWSLLGVLWLATRSQDSRPVIVYVQSAAPASPTGQLSTSPLNPRALTELAR